MDIRNFIKEDLGSGDVTSEAVLRDERAKAHISAKEDCIVAGIGEAIEVFKHFNLSARPLVKDGDFVRAGTAILEVEGHARSILSGERLALNFLMRMSGIATETHSLVDACRRVNSKIRIAATRKTTPGFRHCEKKAVRLGGGDPHRYKLDDTILIKDNHLRLLALRLEAEGERDRGEKNAVEAAVETAVEMAKNYSFTKKVEVEVEDLPSAERAAKVGADIIMLDNMTPEEAGQAAERIRSINPNVLVEVSGNITPENIREYAVFADIISLGYLTHSARAVDFSLDIENIFF